MIVDTGALLAFFDTDEPDHETVSAVLGAATELTQQSQALRVQVDHFIAKVRAG